MNPLHSLKTFVLDHWRILLWAALALGAWNLLNRYVGETHAAVVGPEFLTRFAIKIVGIALAAYLTLHADKWVAPTISAFCSKSPGDTMSDFERAWKKNPEDPRLKLCVVFYSSMFCVLCVVFAL